MATHDGAGLDIERAVRERYSQGAKKVEAELCCPTQYDNSLLAAIPKEVLDCDYGCGDPTRHLRKGEVVLDLGSGSGKICFIASQVVGPEGRVIGVDMNDDMLAVAQRNAPQVAERVGYSNVAFKKGKIQDLRLDLELLEIWLEFNPVRCCGDLEKLEQHRGSISRSQPLIADESVDVVISNCVLNLVNPNDKDRLFNEIFRVLKRGGRAIISDITSDEDVPEHLQRNPELWSGCVSGALREDEFLGAFENAGFYGIEILERQAEPWRTVEGIEFRSVTVTAFKGKEGPCLDRKHAVVYRGPFQQVADDDGHVIRRGVRTAVCEKTFHIYEREPYRSHFELIPPRELPPLDQAPPFPCTSEAIERDPRETKGANYRATTKAGTLCGGSNGSCC